MFVCNEHGMMNEPALHGQCAYPFVNKYRYLSRDYTQLLEPMPRWQYSAGMIAVYEELEVP